MTGSRFFFFPPRLRSMHEMTEGRRRRTQKWCNKSSPRVRTLEYTERTWFFWGGGRWPVIFSWVAFLWPAGRPLRRHANLMREEEEEEVPNLGDVSRIKWAARGVEVGGRREH